MGCFSGIYRLLFALSLAGVPALAPALAQAPGESPSNATVSAPAGSAVADWTVLADLALAGPVILSGTVERARRMSGKAAEGVPPGEVRMLVEVALTRVLKAPGLLPARAEWIWQGPAGAGRRPPIAKGDAVLAFLSAPMAGPKPEVAQFRLVAPAGQRPWGAADEAAVRAILAEVPKAGALMVTGVADGFRSEGDVAGASESQFFLGTDTGRPLTLVVTRRPDAAPMVRVATGELIAASATPIRRETLLWRALACGLPERLPARLAADAGLVADYALARDALGACGARGVP